MKILQVTASEYLKKAYLRNTNDPTILVPAGVMFLSMRLALTLC